MDTEVFPDGFYPGAAGGADRETSGRMGKEIFEIVKHMRRVQAIYTHCVFRYLAIK